MVRYTEKESDKGLAQLPRTAEAEAQLVLRCVATKPRLGTAQPIRPATGTTHVSNTGIH